MDVQIDGSLFPVLRIALQPGERLVAETGELSWKSPNVTLTTSTAGAGNSGFLGSISRMVAGGGLFMTEYRAEGAPGIVAFAAKIPGHITGHQLDGSRAYLVHRHGFIAGTEGVRLDLAFQRKLGAGLFGGDGLFLARLTGPGRIWLQTLTLSNLAGALGPYLGATEAKGAVEGTLLGSLVRKAFD
ncbi:AIM24 family protein [Asaia prunellae]|uniref:AIM24 family protein n=1 Tax=Asaia prunellae TaxID=610245 RepID=UPI00046F5F03|nr:AIM24 family protein [Asaia prunellae]